MINFPAPTAITASPQLIATVPPGSVTVIFSNTGSTNVIYIGTSNTVSTSNGFPLPVNATVTIPGSRSSGPTPIWAVAAGTGNNLGVIISTDK